MAGAVIHANFQGRHTPGRARRPPPVVVVSSPPPPNLFPGNSAPGKPAGRRRNPRRRARPFAARERESLRRVLICSAHPPISETKGADRSPPRRRRNWAAKGGCGLWVWSASERI
nr:unnamed protein product [Digitaria exilis]